MILLRKNFKRTHNPLCEIYRFFCYDTRKYCGWFYKYHNFQKLE